MSKTVTLRLEHPLYQLLVQHAKSEQRSLANLLQLAARYYLEHTTWASDDEMQSILRQPTLMKKIRRGSADAAKRKGRLVG